jgi:hypothetical protein
MFGKTSNFVNKVDIPTYNSKKTVGVGKLMQLKKYKRLHYTILECY